MKWFRLYNEIVDDPKILQLRPESRWHFIACLCIANRLRERSQFASQSTLRRVCIDFASASKATNIEADNKGSLPDIKTIAAYMRLAPSHAKRIIARLIDAGLIDEDHDTKELTIHGWSKRQFHADDVTSRTHAYKERSKERSRERSEEHRVNVPRGRSGTFSDTDKEKNKKLSHSVPQFPVTPPAGTHAHAREANGRPPPVEEATRRRLGLPDLSEAADDPVIARELAAREAARKRTEGTE